jgi:hypothetical protein
MAQRFLTHRLGRLLTVAVLVGCANTGDEHASTELPSAVSPAATTIAERPPTTDAIVADLTTGARGSLADASVRRG